VKLLKKNQNKNIKNFIFKKFIFNKNNKNSLIITNFSEFGVETLACLYSIPIIKNVYKNHKIVVVGWCGREYLYRHIVDEFWEMDESLYYLKDKSNAFLNQSKDIKNLEKELNKIAPVISTGFLGNFFVSKVCKNCLNYWTTYEDVCIKCNSKNISFPILETLNKKD
jgi:hypothetical protein